MPEKIGINDNPDYVSIDTDSTLPKGGGQEIGQKFGWLSAGQNLWNPYELISSVFSRRGMYHYPVYCYLDFIYRLFQDMLDKDPHLQSLFNTLSQAVIARQRKIMPKSNKRIDKKIADCVEKAFDNISDFTNVIYMAMQAVPFGNSNFEIIWEYNEKSGYIFPKRLIHKWNGYFAYDINDKLQYSPNSILQTGSINGIWQEAPDKKFLVFRNRTYFGNMYGYPVLIPCYWYWFAKKNNISFWMKFNEMWGHPILDATYAPQIEKDEITAIEKLMTDWRGWMHHSNKITMSIMEAKGSSGSAEAFKMLSEECNAEMSKFVLGSKLAIDSASGRGSSGSYALGKVHETVRMEYVQSYAQMISDGFAQLVKWIVELNFGKNADCPTWEIDCKDEEDQKLQIELALQAKKEGYQIPASHIYKILKIAAPDEGEATASLESESILPTLAQYGVLTINEIRAKMKLPPVKWGNVPPPAIQKAGLTDYVDAQDMIPGYADMATDPLLSTTINELDKSDENQINTDQENATQYSEALLKKYWKKITGNRGGE